jgi:hypothetical protein
MPIDLGFSELAKQRTGWPVKSEFQINNEYFSALVAMVAIFGIYVY